MLKEGRIAQGNFDSYHPMRIDEAPRNANFAAMGKRIRTLPIKRIRTLPIETAWSWAATRRRGMLAGSRGARLRLIV
jgi:CO/xanthine dehydrogenase Mo-binding subunit